MNEQLVLFEGNEVKVITDKGETLINLANTGKICGVTRKDRNKNTERVRWTGSGGIGEKLNKIRENLVISTGGENPPQENYNKYIEEIDYVLDEIDNGDDRNSIFMSSWIIKKGVKNGSIE
ncbi:hypothetical protein [Clostridium sp. VAP52]|uniref:hypothetical protein n=1 Tax=Clostridium sp. VAP52 TaxID=2949977 RepID=UPI00207AB507|nr:hypothetical protein [Clostridium sp. VAP52]